MHLGLFPQDVCVHRTRDHVDQHEKYLLEKLTYLFLRLINTRLHIFVSSVNPLHTTWNLLFHLGDHSGFSLQHFLGGNGLASEMLELKGVSFQLGILREGDAIGIFFMTLVGSEKPKEAEFS